MPDAGDDRVVDPLVRVRPGFAWKDPDRRAAGLLRSARRGRHHFSEAAGDDDRSTFSEEPADLLGVRLVLGAAPDDGHLNHTRMLERLGGRM